MTRLSVLALALLLAGCSTAPPAAGPPSAGASAPAPSGPAPSTGSVPTAGATAGSAGAGSPEPAPNRSPYTVTADWTTRPVAVAHPLVAPPLRRLTEVRFGDHPGNDPNQDRGYSRVTFAFAGGFPSYDLRYVPAVEQDGSGEHLVLPGNAFVRIVFRDAQAHDAGGRPAPLPPTTVGYPTLKGYAFGGDFEGYVTFGLGLQTAVGSDQTLPIRVGELVRPDGSYVVAVDVRR